MPAQRQVLEKNFWQRDVLRFGSVSQLLGQHVQWHQQPLFVRHRYDARHRQDRPTVPSRHVIGPVHTSNRGKGQFGLGHSHLPVLVQIGPA